MYRSQHAPAPRKGIILLVVLALLTLFTIIGISFVLYADAAAKQAQTGKEATVDFRPNMSPEECLSLFLDQLIFDVRDDESGVYSSLRGHGLMRNMYGFNYDWADQVYGGVRTTLNMPPNGFSKTTASPLTITVTSSASFPVAPMTGTTVQFYIQIDSEQFGVRTMNGNRWVVTAAANGTARADHANGATVTVVTSPDFIAQNGNDVPFNGIGRLHYNTTIPGAAGPVDDWKMVNYMYFQSAGHPLRDPERGPRTGTGGLRAPGAPDNRGPYLASANVSYTYADINNFYLGAIDGLGNLLTPSFHREWLFGRLDDPNNPNWTNAEGRYLTLRPRPIDHAGFPYPADRGGDVKNLVGYPGGNDSIWIDIGAPVMTAPDGRKYKMLVAPLILDLDGRLNVNVHGNKMGLNPLNPHASNQGLGPWEVNLGQLLKATTTSGQWEWVQLFDGRTNPTIIGRYGPNKTPLINLTTNDAPAIPLPHYFSQLDITGRGPGPIQMPTGLANPFPFYAPGAASWPAYDNGKADIDPVTKLNVRHDHAMLYQDFAPFTPRVNAAGVGQPWNRRFPTSNMERLFRWQDTGYEALTSDLERLLPLNFANVVKSRNLLTTDSGDRNRPGLAPYIFDPAAAPYGYLNATGATLELPPVGVPPAFPALTNPIPRVGSGSEFLTDSRQRPDWRSALTSTPGRGLTPLLDGRGLTRLDVNYPIPNPTSATGAPQALLQYPNNANAAGQRYDTDAYLVAPNPMAKPPTLGVTYAERFLQVQAERQFMARQIYLRLLAVTGLSPSAVIPAQPTPAELRPRRWLAQLAVNMVDFIDRDDVSTAFNFYTLADANAKNAQEFDVGAADTKLPGPNPNPQNVTTPLYWVFGTELPRVVINEVLAEYTPDPSPTVGTTKFDNNVWVELLAPVSVPTTQYPNAQPSIDDNRTWLGMPALTSAQTQGGAIPIPQFRNGYAAYQLVIADQIMLPSSSGAAAIPENNNVLGLPLKIRSQTGIGDFGPDTILNMSNGAVLNPGQTAAAIQTPVSNILVVAPPPTAASGNAKYGVDVHKTIAVNSAAFTAGTVPANTPVYPTAGMRYSSTYDTATTFTPDDTKTGITVMLQRLANPHIPPDNRPTINGNVNPWYNPYVTIDYVQNVPLNNSTQQSYASVGKKQPYASRMIATGVGTGPVVPDATKSLVVNQNGLTAGAVQHTFGKSNNTTAATSPAAAPGANSKYDWLPHLDRMVTSPLELLHVSQYQPHQLTQKFMLQDAAPIAANAALRFQHAPVATWYDESRRLYRLLEFLEVRNRALGSSNASEDGRITGKINLNAVWDFETFLALCDPQLTNNFTAADVAAVWTKLIELRSPMYARNAGTTFTQGGSLVGPADKPFLGHAPGAFLPNATAQYPLGQGINDTILRSYDGTDRRLFDTPASMTRLQTDNPYVRTELLSKIFNNITTRSNVFAVWVTVGFFEVKDDTTRPVKLGAEMNASEGKAVRHRMFAVVDRSVLPANPYPSVPTRNFTVLPPKAQFRPSAPATAPVDLRGLVPHWSVVD